MLAIAATVETSDTEPAPDVALQLVPVELVPRVLEPLAKYLVSIADRSGGRFTIESLVGDLVRGECQLWIIGDDQPCGIVVTELYFASSGAKVAAILGATGEGYKGWLHLISDLEAWAVAEGCVKLEAWARKGWARKLTDYKMTHVMLEKDLT